MDSHDDDLGVHMCAEDSMHVNVAEDDPGTGSMEINGVEMLIGWEEGHGAQVDRDDTHLQTLHLDDLEAPNDSQTLLGCPEQDEIPANDLEVAQADGLPVIISEEKIRVFVCGKKAKVGTKRKDIDDYLNLFINAHHLPCNRRCWHIHSNIFFSNHGL